MASPSVLLVAAAFLILPAVACGDGTTPPSQPSGSPVPTVTVDSALLAPLATAINAEPSAETGAQLAQAYGCPACHSIDGAALVGPTWLGLYDTEEALEGGGTATVDDEYITESIKDPNAKIVQGFTAGLMPATLGVKDEEIPHLIAYMKSLR